MNDPVFRYINQEMLRQSEPERFDHTNDDHLKQIVPNRLVGPLMSLLQLRDEVLGWQRIGDINHKNTVDLFMKKTKSLESDLKLLWQDL